MVQAIRGLRTAAPKAVPTAALAALLVALAPHPASARVIPPSVLPGLGPLGAGRRVPVDVDRPPWRGVVLVQTEAGVRCTGALIGPSAVLTAAHCLLGRVTGRLLRPQSVHVLAGYRGGDYAAHARAAAVAVGPGFAAGLDRQLLPSAPPDSDWAVLRLDAPLVGADRVLPLAPAPPPGTVAMLGGYEQDRAQVVVADTACAAAGLVPGGVGHGPMLRHTCAATRGASGAPLLVRAADGNWAVAGVASQAGLGAQGGLAVPVAAVPPDVLTAAGARPAPP